MRTQGEASLLFSSAAGSYGFSWEAGKKVGHDIAGATHEDEVKWGGGVGQGRAVCFRRRRDGGCRGDRGPVRIPPLFRQEGPVGRGLRPVVDGLAGQEPMTWARSLSSTMPKTRRRLRAGWAMIWEPASAIPPRCGPRVADGMGWPGSGCQRPISPCASADRAEAPRRCLGWRIVPREERGDGREDGVGVARLVVATQVAQERAKATAFILATPGVSWARKDLGTVRQR